jgi:hypothetical protein
MFHRKKQAAISYDTAIEKPVIKASICTGEQVGGLKDRKTGHFEEIMVIRGRDDLQAFQNMTGKTDIPKEY